MTFVRLVLGVLIACMVMVTALPAVVLVDLVSGGTGLGLCPSGLATCTTSAFTVVELVIVLALVLGALGAGIAVCLRVLRSVQGPGGSMGL